MAGIELKKQCVPLFFFSTRRVSLEEEHPRKLPKLRQSAMFSKLQQKLSMNNVQYKPAGW
jgi:hypothetical protein